MAVLDRSTITIVASSASVMGALVLVSVLPDVEKNQMSAAIALYAVFLALCLGSIAALGSVGEAAVGQGVAKRESIGWGASMRNYRSAHPGLHRAARILRVIAFIAFIALIAVAIVDVDPQPGSATHHAATTAGYAAFISSTLAAISPLAPMFSLLRTEFSSRAA